MQLLQLPLRMSRPIVVLFGDSITQQGFGWEGGTGWVSLLSSTYSRRADVFNRGYSGYNTRHGVNLLPKLFGGSSSRRNPDMLGSLGKSNDSDNENDDGSNDSNTYDDSYYYYKHDVLFVTIFFGANDAALPGELQHVPIEEYGDNLSTMIQYIRNNTTTNTNTNSRNRSSSTTSNHGDNESSGGTEKEDDASTVCRNDGVNGDKSPTTSDDDDDNKSNGREEDDLIPIILMTPPPVDIDAWYKNRNGGKDDDRRNDRANDNAKRYGQRVKEIGSTFQRCSVVDVFDLLGGNGPVSNYTKHLRDGLHLSSSGNQLVYDGLMNVLQLDYPQLLPMMDGNGRYGPSGSGVPLEEKLWRELC